jgi:hypothetical protein
MVTLRRITKTKLRLSQFRFNFGKEDAIPKQNRTGGIFSEYGSAHQGHKGQMSKPFRRISLLFGIQ